MTARIDGAGVETTNVVYLHDQVDRDSGAENTRFLSSRELLSTPAPQMYHYLNNTYAPANGTNNN